LSRIVGRVIGSNAQQHQESATNATDEFTGNRNLGLTDSLDTSTHG
jgi:hypothetical protein